MRFDIDAIRRRVGDRVFARGEVYHRDGHVEILTLGRNRIVACVSGTEDYRTELAGAGGAVSGACSCPAFEETDFCKHMVAVALAANAAPESQDNGFGRIRAYLLDQDRDALIALIIEATERDPTLFRRLDLAASMARGDDEMVEKTVGKTIDQATRIRNYIGYDAAPAWAAEVRAALDHVDELVVAGRGVIALKLVDRAIERIEQASESIDDSDGHCGALLGRATEIHVAAARVAKPEPVAFARQLFARAMAWRPDDSGAPVELYAEALGEKGLAEYRRLAIEAWEKLPAHVGRKAGRTTGEYVPHDELLHILDYFAALEGDVDRRIALRAKHLSSPWAYRQLAEFCLSQGRPDEALRRAEEGLWMFEDGGPDENLAEFAAELLANQGRTAEAAAHLWRSFEHAPDLEGYLRLKELTGKAALIRAVNVLEERLARRSRGGWGNSASVLVDILMEEERFDQAWVLMRRPGASTAKKQVLAAATEKSHPQEAVAAYEEHVNWLVETGGNDAYAKAAALIGRLAKLRNATEQAAYVAALKERFSRKRNFIKLLI